MFNFNRLFFVRLIVTIVILCLGVIIYFSLTATRKSPASHKEAGEKIWTLACLPVKDSGVRLSVAEYGTVKPIDEVTISSLVKGEIKYILPDLREGQIVRKGEVILKVDDSDYKISLNKAIAEIEQLKAQIEQQKVRITNSKPLLSAVMKQYKLEEVKYKRYLELYKKRAVIKSDYETPEKNLAQLKSQLVEAEGEIKNVVFELNSLEAELKAAETVKKKAELDIQRCTVKSPINGRIVDESLSKAEYVTEGTPLFTVVNDAKLEIPIPLSIEDAVNIFSFVHNKKDYVHWFRFAKNIPVKIYWNGKTQNMVWEGKIIGVEKFDDDTRTITFLVAPVKEEEKQKTYIPLVSGMFCKVVLEGKIIKNAMRVPLNSIQLNHCVYTVDKNKRLKQHAAKVIRYEESTAVISVKNIKSAAYLVVQKLPQGITDGAKIELIKPLNFKD